jgi:hypothetical protein
VERNEVGLQLHKEALFRTKALDRLTQKQQEAKLMKILSIVQTHFARDRQVCMSLPKQAVRGRRLQGLRDDGQAQFSLSGRGSALLKDSGSLMHSLTRDTHSRDLSLAPAF